MSRTLQISIVVLLSLLSDGVAQEPAKVVPSTPAPPANVVIIDEVVLPNPPPRVGTRDIWRYYAVDSRGRFRPRVVMAPYNGSYYYGNGAWYPYLPIQNRIVRQGSD